jgi:hypothetical protein
MELNVSGIYTYTPHWRGNDKLAKDKRVQIEYTYLSAEDEEAFTTFTPVYRGKDREEMEMEVKSNACAIWDKCVRKVSGITSDGKAITDPLAIRKIPGIYGLVSEVAAHIKKGIDEEELKN